MTIVTIIDAARSLTCDLYKRICQLSIRRLTSRFGLGNVRFLALSFGRLGTRVGPLLRRHFAFVALWTAIVTVGFTAVGCSPVVPMAPLQVPEAQVRLVCWDPPEKGTGDEYFVFPGNSDQAVSESREAAFLAEVRNGGFIFKYMRGAPASSLNLIPLTRTDAWCEGIPEPLPWALPLLEACPQESALEMAPPAAKQFVAQSSDPAVKSPFFCNQQAHMAPTTQELMSLRARNAAYQEAYQQAGRIAKALTIAEAEMQEVLNKDDWTLRNLIASKPESIDAIQARVAHELESIEAPPAYDDTILDNLALAGFQRGFEDAKFKAEAALFAIDAGWLILDIAVAEVILGPLGGAKLAASGLSKGSKALNAALVRLGEIPIFLPVGVGPGGFMPIGKLIGGMSARAHRYALEAAMKLPPFNMTRQAGQALHHIVGLADEEAELARRILKKFKVHIDEAYNGVYLPASTKSPNPMGSMVHSKLHTKEYYRKVNKFLGVAKSRQDVIERLERIRKTLLDGTFHDAIK